MAKKILALPDGHYRKCFRQVTVDLPLIPAEANDAPSRNGTLMMIGTLGPGGAERQLVATAKALAEKNAGLVSVACRFLNDPAHRFYLPELDAAGIQTTVIGNHCATRSLRPAIRSFIASLPLSLHEVESYAATFSATRPKIAHLWLDEINIKGGIAAVLTGVPQIILSQRSLPPPNFVFHQPYMREGYRWLARQPNVVMTNNSEAGAHAYEKWLNLPRGRIIVVRNGYAFNEQTLLNILNTRGHHRRIAGIPIDVPVVGGVMRLSEEKRPLLWLEIAALVRWEIPEVHFLIVGDGPMRAAVEERARKPDLAGAVHLLGHVTDAQTAMVDMDILLLTSRAEGLPNALVEAQFVGVPVVATRVGGVPEAVDHSRSGWVLDSDNAETAGARLVQLLRDKEWRRDASVRGPEFAASRFGMRRAIDEIMQIYSIPFDAK